MRSITIMMKIVNKRVGSLKFVDSSETMLAIAQPLLTIAERGHLPAHSAVMRRRINFYKERKRGNALKISKIYLFLYISENFKLKILKL